MSDLHFLPAHPFPSLYPPLIIRARADLLPSVVFTVVVIGCGSYQPIKQYAEASHSPYPIYANPSLSLYTAFNCVSNYGTSKKGEEKEYEKDLGSSTTRVWQALVQGPAKHLEHVNYVGPKGQNGAELVVDSGTSTLTYSQKDQRRERGVRAGEVPSEQRADEA